jgi:hypothetical protein
MGLHAVTERFRIRQFGEQPQPPTSSIGIQPLQLQRHVAESDGRPGIRQDRSLDAVMALQSAPHDGRRGAARPAVSDGAGGDRRRPTEPAAQADTPRRHAGTFVAMSLSNVMAHA